MPRLIHRPLLILFLSMIAGISVIEFQGSIWVVVSAVALVIASLVIKQKSLAWILAGLCLSLVSSILWIKPQYPKPSDYLGNIQIRTFSDYRKDHTRVLAHLPKTYETEVRFPGHVHLAPGDQIDVVDQAPGERSRTISVTKFEIIRTSGLHPIAELRYSLLDQIEQNFRREDAPWIQSLTFNYPTELTKNEKESLLNSGTYHLVSASGLHIYVVALLMTLLLHSIGLRREYVILLSAEGLTLFCFLTGFHACTIRATLMWLISSVSYFFYRSNDRLSALALSGIIWLSFDPLAIFQVGFQLSFLASSALVVWFERTTVSIDSWRSGLEASIVATLATEPLAVWWFGRVAWTGVISNILVELPCLLIMVFGFLSFLPFIGQIFVFATTPLLDFVRWVTSELGNETGIQVMRQPFPSWAMVAYYLLLFAVLFYWQPVRLAKQDLPRL